MPPQRPAAREKNLGGFSCPCVFRSKDLYEKLGRDERQLCPRAHTMASALTALENVRCSEHVKGLLGFSQGRVNVESYVHCPGSCSGTDQSFLSECWEVSGCVDQKRTEMGSRALKGYEETGERVIVKKREI
jgi:hypothetical protein